MGDNVFKKRLDALKEQNPALRIKEGLEVLAQLPVDHPLRAELGPNLIKADMLASQKKPGV